MHKFPRLAVIASLVTAAVLPLPAAAQSEPYLGQISCFGFNFAPRGWMLAEGQLLPIATNTALFSLLGTQYGGDGRTTFALPDLRGRVMFHWGQGPGLTTHSIGEMGGSENTTLTLQNLPAHVHSVAPLASNGDATSVTPAGKVPAAKARSSQYGDASVSPVAMAPSTTSPAGGNQPAPIMQPYTTVTCAIAVEGIFPSRN